MFFLNFHFFVFWLLLYLPPTCGVPQKGFSTTKWVQDRTSVWPFVFFSFSLSLFSLFYGFMFICWEHWTLSTFSHFSISVRVFMSSFICRQLINLVHAELFSTLPQRRPLLLIVLRLHWTSLSSSVVEPSPASVPIVSQSLPVLHLVPTSFFDCAAFVVVSSSPSETFPVTVPRAS